LAHPTLSIIIPAHNEAGRIGPVLASYQAAFGPSTEFIVVPNACTDETETLAQNAASTDSRVRVHVIRDVVGKVGAVYAGFSLARGSLIGFVDADGATSPEEFQKLVTALQTHDVVVASRWRRGAHVERKFIRKFASLVFVILRHLVVPLSVRDTQCGAKVMRREAYERVAPTLRVKNQAFDVELLARLNDSGARILELPTVWREPGGSVQFDNVFSLARTGLTMFRTLWKIRTRPRITFPTL
jgi:glycosyltransferase involved in cell wall biosynthesis